jgi:hypothetical protein
MRSPGKSPGPGFSSDLMKTDCEFHAIAESKFSVDGMDMVFHCLFRYLELFADLPV